LRYLIFAIFVYCTLMYGVHIDRRKTVIVTAVVVIGSYILDYLAHNALMAEISKYMPSYSSVPQVHYSHHRDYPSYADNREISVGELSPTGISYQAEGQFPEAASLENFYVSPLGSNNNPNTAYSVNQLLQYRQNMHM
jgi:hypothetical protein